MLVSVSTAAVDYDKPAKFTHYESMYINSLDSLREIITREVWSPIVWRGGKREQASFISSELAVLDFDDPDLTLAQAVKTFCDTDHIIGTTKSHQKEKNGIVCDRFRVVLPWDRLCDDLSNYRFNMRTYYKRYPCDKCFDGARYFFPCTKIVSFLEEGEKETLIEGKEKTYRKSSDKYSKAGVLPGLARHGLQMLVPPGGRNRFFYGVAKDLAKAGFSSSQIMGLIKISKTFKDKWNESYEREYISTVESAIGASKSER